MNTITSDDTYISLAEALNLVAGSDWRLTPQGVQFHPKIQKIVSYLLDHPDVMALILSGGELGDDDDYVPVVTA